MSAANFQADLYQLRQSGDAAILDPGASGTFDLRGRDLATVTVSATGTYTLPDSPVGTQLLVCCDDTSTITLADASGTIHVFTGTSGTTSVLCTATDSNSWAAVRQVQATTDQSLAAVYTHLLSTQGFIDLPLASWREISSDDIINAAGNGGVLATDSTPALEYVNGDTDSQIRVLWAATNVDKIARQITLPPDLDRTANIVLHVRGVVGGGTDTPGMTVETFFDEGDTKVSDSIVTFTSSVANTTATIAAADVPDTATTMSAELTPGTHDNDTLAVYAIWLTYTKKLLTS